MGQARIFTPENRLARVLSSLQGATAEQLVANAEARVAGLETAIRAYVQDRLTPIMAYADLDEAALFARCQDLGAMSLDISEVAAAGGMVTIGEAARGISAMVEGLLDRGVWHTDALKLHLDALALLSQTPSPGAAQVKAIMDQLLTMRRSIGISE
ncbi:MAG: hypothetical protein Q8L23_10810 [Caulobacter sp.]|nr:hypothetical protein [Caulobacter sp.]